MPRRSNPLAVLVLAGAAVFFFAPGAVAEQRARAGGDQPAELDKQLIARGPLAPRELDQQRASETREAFRRVMQLYPPALGRVLRLDPTLMTNAAYLAPYPALGTFLERHPEVPRYSEYYLNFVGDSNSYEPDNPEFRLRSDAMNMWRNVLQGLMMFTVFLTVILTLTWLVRYIVGHRRWLRATRLQTEVHSKLMERFTSNDELLAYVQSAAGRHFLQAVPVTADAVNTPGIAAPFGRILWSIQAGLVLACGGVGLLVIKQYVIEEVGQMMLVFGALAISLGTGFALSAAASYILSQRLGLFDATRPGSSNGA